MPWVKDYIFHWSAIIEGILLYHAWIFAMFLNFEEESVNKEDVEYYGNYIRIASNCRLAFSLCILVFNNKYNILEYGHVLVTHCIIRMIALVTILRAEYCLHVWIVPLPMLIGAGLELLYLLYLYVEEKDMLNWERWNIAVFREEEKTLDEVTLAACEKLAEGWRKIKNGEMTEEELERHEEHLRAIYNLIQQS